MNVIKQVAKIHNVSEEEVRREIQAVIHAAMQSKDPQVQKRWAENCKNGKEPTPEKLIRYLSRKVCSNLNQ